MDGISIVHIIAVSLLQTLKIIRSCALYVKEKATPIYFRIPAVVFVCIKLKETGFDSPWKVPLLMMLIDSLKYFGFFSC